MIDVWINISLWETSMHCICICWDFPRRATSLRTLGWLTIVDGKQHFVPHLRISLYHSTHQIVTEYDAIGRRVHEAVGLSCSKTRKCMFWQRIASRASTDDQCHKRLSLVRAWLSSIGKIEIDPWCSGLPYALRNGFVLQIPSQKWISFLSAECGRTEPVR